MTELDRYSGSNGSHETKIQDFVEVTLFSPSELEKDGAKFTEIAKIDPEPIGNTAIIIRRRLSRSIRLTFGGRKDFRSRVGFAEKRKK